ncbi:MAG: hypothetical protein ACI4R8_01820 [Candidatus Caccovivens sp.]
MNNEVCSKCGTTAEEILQTGFVGCEKCYELLSVRLAVDNMYGGKRHKN